MITYNNFLNELYIRKKNSDYRPGKHNILYIIGSAPEISKEGKLIVRRSNQSKYNILGQFGDEVYWPQLYYHGGDMIFDEMEEIIEEKGIDMLVGYSAGGYISFNLSNKFNIPNLSVNPAIGNNCEAPTLQLVRHEMLKNTNYSKHIITVGELDRKDNGGVDTDKTLEFLDKIKFEERGGELITLKDTYHRLTDDQFNNVFRHFYKKFFS